MATARTALFARNTPGGIFTIDDIAEHPNNIWFVDSTHANAGVTVGHGTSPDSPFSTLSYAFSSDLMVAGDVCYVAPAHVETLAAAAGIASDIAGIKVIGLGWGAMRPTFSFSATDSTWTISGANVVIKNIRVRSTVVELVNMFTVSAAGVTLDAVDVVDNTTNTIIQFLLTTAAADDLTIQNCEHHSLTVAAAAQILIQFILADLPKILNNWFDLKLKNATSVYTIAATDTACLNMLIKGNVIHQVGGATQTHFVNLVAGCTGVFADNYAAGDIDALVASFELASLYAFQNFAVVVVEKSGVLDPVIA